MLQYCNYIEAKSLGNAARCSKDNVFSVSRLGLMICQCLKSCLFKEAAFRIDLSTYICPELTNISQKRMNSGIKTAYAKSSFLSSPWNQSLVSHSFLPPQSILTASNPTTPNNHYNVYKSLNIFKEDRENLSGDGILSNSSSLGLHLGLEFSSSFYLFPSYAQCMDSLRRNAYSTK